jgi:hypothetical protein
VVAVVGVGIWLVLVVDGYKRCWEVNGSGGIIGLFVRRWGILVTVTNCTSALSMEIQPYSRFAQGQCVHSIWRPKFNVVHVDC